MYIKCFSGGAVTDFCCMICVICDSYFGFWLRLVVCQMWAYLVEAFWSTCAATIVLMSFRRCRKLIRGKMPQKWIQNGWTCPIFSQNERLEPKIPPIEKETHLNQTSIFWVLCQFSRFFRSICWLLGHSGDGKRSNLEASLGCQWRLPVPHVPWLFIISTAF